MADHKHSHVWSSFSSQNSNNAVFDVCGRADRYSGNTTDLVKHMRFNHNTEYEEVMQQQSEDEEKKGAAKKRQTSVTESFGTDRHLSGTERV